MTFGGVLPTLATRLRAGAMVRKFFFSRAVDSGVVSPRPGFFQQLTYIWRPPTPPEGFHPPPAREVLAAKLIGAVCFFWIMYKMRDEGAVYLVITKSRPRNG